MRFRDWLMTEGKEVGWAYHVTFLMHLPGIQEKGLKAAGAKSNWSDRFADHVKKGVFFSSKPDAVRYWLSLMTMTAQDHEDPIVGGVVPALLRFRLNRKKWERDGRAERMAGESWYVARVIPPQGIDYWTGRQWVPLLSVRDFDDRPFTDGPERVDPSQPESWQRRLKVSRDYPLPASMYPRIPRLS